MRNTPRLRMEMDGIQIAGEDTQMLKNLNVNGKTNRFLK